MNALLVGLDLLKKALKARLMLVGGRARRRVLLLGTFDTQVGRVFWGGLLLLGTLDTRWWC